MSGFRTLLRKIRSKADLFERVIPPQITDRDIFNNHKKTKEANIERKVNSG